VILLVSEGVVQKENSVRAESRDRYLSALSKRDNIRIYRSPFDRLRGSGFKIPTFMTTPSFLITARFDRLSERLEIF
jgi:hypothetical protein